MLYILRSKFLLRFQRLSVYQRGLWYDYHNGVNSCLVRVIDYITLVMNLIYKWMHIALDEKLNDFVSWKMILESSCEVDIECDYIIIPRWKNIFRYEISAISLGCGWYLLCNALMQKEGSIFWNFYRRQCVCNEDFDTSDNLKVR